MGEFFSFFGGGGGGDGGALTLAIALGKYLSLWGNYHLKELAEAGGLVRLIMITVNSVYFPKSPRHLLPKPEQSTIQGSTSFTDSCKCY